MVQAASMAASASRIEISRARLMAAIDDYAAAVRTAAGSSLGEGLIHTREARDRLEAVFAEGLRRFDQSGEYAADGAIDVGPGIVRLDGLLAAAGGAIVRNAVSGYLPTGKDDERTPGQRRADRLVELCQPRAGASADGAGPRPHLIIRASVDTLIGATGSPGGELDGGAIIPAETVRRSACDPALSRMIGKGELDAEITRASRSTPPSTRRALAVRDRGCVAEHCTPPPQWTDTHHVKHWIDQGPTTMTNLILLCRPHHRKVHEEGWGLQRLTTGRWALIRPVAARSRSA